MRGWAYPATVWGLAVIILTTGLVVHLTGHGDFWLLVIVVATHMVAAGLVLSRTKPTLAALEETGRMRVELETLRQTNNALHGAQAKGVRTRLIDGATVAWQGELQTGRLALVITSSTLTGDRERVASVSARDLLNVLRTDPGFDAALRFGETIAANDKPPDEVVDDIPF